VRKRRHRTGAGQAHGAVSWRAGNASQRTALAATGEENNFPKAPKCIPVFNTPFV
jgi:hypothetical protein